MTGASASARVGSIAITALCYFLVVAPIAVVVIVAFTPTDFFVFPPPGVSLRWFHEFFRLENMRNAFMLSVQVALFSASIAAILGTMGALFLVRRRGVVSTLMQSLFLAPLVFPTIILGLALLLLYKSVGMPVLPGLLLAHAVVGMPYAFRTVLASLQGMDPALEEAGQSLGAGPIRTLFLVTLPLIWPGVPVRLAVRLHRLVRRAQHGAVPDRAGPHDAADRGVQLSAVPGQPARHRRRLGAAESA